MRLKKKINGNRSNSESLDFAAQNLAIAARASLSEYCHLECKAHCCRKGYLLLSANEVGLMKNTDIEKLDIMPVHLDSEDKEQMYIFDLSSGVNGCPNLINFQCSIHTNPLRPSTCKEFPIFFWKNKTILITDDCFGIKENKLYAFLAEFKKMGYTLRYSSDKKIK